MGAKVTMSLRSLVLAAAVAVALVAAYAIGAAASGGTPASAAGETQGAATTDTRTIVMTGVGAATGVPDQLMFRFSVHQKAYDVKDALTAANTTMRRVLAAVSHRGVARKDVQTTGMSIRPEYDYRAGGPPVLTGYVVSESAAVLVRDLGASGKVIDAAARAGGNAVRMHGLGLRIGDRDALMRQARAAAVAEAKAKAKQYARATGQTLGAVVSLKEVRATPAPAVYDMRSTMDVAGSAAVPIRAGSEDLKVTVSIVWQLA